MIKTLNSRLTFMPALLYTPGNPPQPVEMAAFTRGRGIGPDARQVAALLGCALGLVDVLAKDVGYVAFSIFDCEDLANEEAMKVLTELTGVPFDPSEEDEILRGAVLVVIE